MDQVIMRTRISELIATMASNDGPFWEWELALTNATIPGEFL